MTREDYVGYAVGLIPDGSAEQLSRTLEQDARRYSRSLSQDAEVRAR